MLRGKNVAAPTLSSWNASFRLAWRVRARIESPAIALMLFLVLAGAIGAAGYGPPQLKPMGAAHAAPSVCPEAAVLTFEPSAEIRRDRLGFTQGLEVFGGALLESTGAYGDTSVVNTIDLDGRVTRIASLEGRLFGEGLTVLNGEIFQLTWKDHTVLVYNLDGSRKREMRNPRDGWGLTNDGRRLIFTDGGHFLHLADPATFKILRSVAVRDRAAFIEALNELEFVDGKVMANVFGTNRIVRIDPASGCVDGKADLTGLRRSMPEEERRRLAAEPNFVLNGIAHDPATGLFYLTGKSWRTIFVGRFRT
jgi:glutaminyl-peptide cyclotransferase